ncbi:MAG: M56 family metallopeptidase [Bacteroidales bacterium]|nr:M56 family metallopeptidase [Bacteroidales bacterium]
MTEFLIYQAKTAIALAAFYMFYRLLLSRETFHRFNRVVLLGTTALSFVLPFCTITLNRTVIVHDPLAAAVPIMEDSYSGTVSEYAVPWLQIGLLALFIAGACAMLMSVAVSVIRIKGIVRHGEKRKLESGETLVITDMDTSPFSWMKYIVVSREDYDMASAAESGFNEIITHEKAHIAMRHSWDLLFVDLAAVMQWFNPAIWMLKADLRALHEFEADDAVLKSGTDIRKYQYLLIRKAVGKSGYSVANSFNHSTLKQRITMMLNKKSTIRSAWKALYIIPIAGISLAATARTAVDYRYDAPAAHMVADSLKGKVTQISIKKEKKDTAAATNVLYIVDGKQTDDISSIDSGQIKSITVYKGQANGLGFDTKGKDGEIIIIINDKDTQDLSNMKASVVGTQSDSKEPFSALYIVDGKELDDLSAIGSSSVVSMEIRKDPETLKKYKAEGKEAVIIVKTKK